MFLIITLSHKSRLKSYLLIGNGMAVIITPSSQDGKNYVGIHAETFESLVSEINNFTSGSSPEWQFDGGISISASGHHFAILRRIVGVGL